jgi:hypothetical protein
VIFLLISRLELLMTEAIRERFGASDEWLLHLSSTRQNDLRKAITTNKRADMYVDALLMTQLCDKRVIIGNPVIFRRPRRSGSMKWRKFRNLETYWFNLVIMQVRPSRRVNLALLSD